MNQASNFFISNSPMYDCFGDHKCISRTQMNADNVRMDMDGFSCSDFNRTTGELWISEDPTGKNMTVPYVGESAPGAKRFYILLPNETEWKSSIPMYSPDGTYESRRPLNVDADMCGWYYVQWLDEELPYELIFFPDGDENLEMAIGSDGWNADVLTPFDIATYFAIYANDDGTEKDKLFFVPDQDLWDEFGESTKGVYDVDPGVSDLSLCTYSLAALIYDTDASLHGAFTCDAYPYVASNGCYSATAKYNYMGNGGEGSVPCIGVTPGIVSKTLPHDKSDMDTYKKPVYNPSSGCFASQEAFDVLFRETDGINAMHCRDVPFTLAKDGLWEYDSSNEPTEMFSPLNDLADSVKAGLCTGTCAIAATLREGQGSMKYGTGSSVEISTLAIQTLGDVENWASTNPATGLPYIDSYPVSAGEFDSGSNPNVYDNFYWDERKVSDANQQFCFESHAKFMYRPGMKFYFRGDDDIWVYIDNTLAVDLGGTHMAAPASVDLDTFEGEKGALVANGEYDIDIFFCDRRTTMSNIRIKTNMYIQQTTGLERKAQKDGSYKFCYTRVVNGSCENRAMGNVETETICDDLPAFVYSIENAKGVVIADSLVAGEPTSIYFGGVDLRNSSSPSIDKNKITGLAPGRYNLVVRVNGDNGKPVKIAFKVAAGLGILPSLGIALDSNGVVCDSSKCPGIADAYYKLEPAMVGEYLPVYISAVVAASDKGVYDMDVTSAVGEKYVFDAGSLLAFVKTVNEKGEVVYEPLASGTERTVGPSGVDTVYVTISMDGLSDRVQDFNVSLGEKSAAVPVTFFIPEISFVDEDGNVFTGEKSGNELWVGTSYSFLLKAFIPSLDGSEMTFCENCNFAVVRGEKTSSGIQLVGDSLVYFKNGLATVSIRASKEYRYDKDDSKNHPATLQVVVEKSSLVSTTIKPLYFREPSVAYPLFADIFDARGAMQGESSLPEPYYSSETKYQDGIADSIVVYFNRELLKDSLPDSVVVYWESETDSVVLGKDAVKKAAVCSSYSKDGARCAPYLGFGQLTLSKNVKTSGTGHVSSWTKFEENGKISSMSFVGNFVDRIAPIPLSASLVVSKEKQNVEILTVVMSEPVRLKNADYENKAVDFYRFGDGVHGSERYGHPHSVKTEIDGNVVTMEFDIDKYAPQAGDYLRLRADRSIWTDFVSLDSKASRSEEDASYKWNYPTTYDAANRAPSPWVLVEMEPVNPGDYDELIYAKPSFRVVLTGPFTFKIVFKDSVKNLNKSYSVMDLKGSVVKSGKVSDGTSVTVKSSGSYIVRVGRGSEVVNFK